MKTFIIEHNSNILGASGINYGEMFIYLFQTLKEKSSARLRSEQVRETATDNQKSAFTATDFTDCLY